MDRGTWCWIETNSWISPATARMPNCWFMASPIFVEHLAKPLLADGTCLNLPKVRVLHSGGWKRLLDQAVEKTASQRRFGQVFGCSPDCIIDFYGMVESVGVIFPDCPRATNTARPLAMSLSEIR